MGVVPEQAAHVFTPLEMVSWTHNDLNPCLSRGPAGFLPFLAADQGSTGSGFRGPAP